MKLYYVLDPMCSWCWGFRDTFEQLKSYLSDVLEIQYVMGGLAPDSDEPMPIETREYVQSQWRAVSDRTGANFNWGFWTQCQPRRSTYPACRAVIAARLQKPEAEASMIHGIQSAYYLNAQNPSDTQTLLAVANDIGLDTGRFEEDIQTPEVEEHLQADFKLRRQLGVDSFPSLRLQDNQQTIRVINIDYRNHESMLAEISSNL